MHRSLSRFASPSALGPGEDYEDEKEDEEDEDYEREQEAERMSFKRKKSKAGTAVRDADREGSKKFVDSFSFLMSDTYVCVFSFPGGVGKSEGGIRTMLRRKNQRETGST